MADKRADCFFLSGARIGLSPLSMSIDLEKYAEWLNDIETTTYMGSGRFPVTKEALASYIKGFENKKEAMLLGIFLAGEGSHIGNITLQQIDWKDRRAEVGLIIGDKASRGKGYGKEAIKLMAAHAFERLNLRKLCAGVIDGNIASRKVFESVGFKVEGVLREHFHLNGSYLDCYRFGLLRSEFSVKQEG